MNMMTNMAALLAATGQMAPRLLNSMHIKGIGRVVASIERNRVRIAVIGSPGGNGEVRTFYAATPAEAPALLASHVLARLGTVMTAAMWHDNSQGPDSPLWALSGLEYHEDDRPIRFVHDMAETPFGPLRHEWSVEASEFYCDRPISYLALDEAGHPHYVELIDQDDAGRELIRVFRLQMEDGFDLLRGVHPLKEEAYMKAIGRSEACWAVTLNPYRDSWPCEEVNSLTVQAGLADVMPSNLVLAPLETAAGDAGPVLA